MKQAVSVSLGACSGDFERTVHWNHAELLLRREGAEGDMQRAEKRIRELDGRVDAIGLGGIDIALEVQGERFYIGDGKRLSQAAVKTPVVDGSGLKHTLEREAVRKLAENGKIGHGTKALMVSALDRAGMAEALLEAGCQCIFGDLIFNMAIDYPLATLNELAELAAKYRTRLLTMPFSMLYPTGARQTERRPDARFAHYYLEADLIAGDRHLIWKHMPDGLQGQTILTNTTRPETLQQFKQAGAGRVITTTPDLEGVTGGTNLMEAALCALAGKGLEPLAPHEYAEWVNRLGWHGSEHTLQ